MKRNKYEIVSFFDTETCNLCNSADSVAYTVLYIFNNITVPVNMYEGTQHDNILYMRHSNEALLHIINITNDYDKSSIVPVVCAYNLLFDIKSLMHGLAQIFDLKVLAKSSTNLYFLDLYKNEKLVLRFWDMFYLDMRGVKALGEACGLLKLMGEWDYDLIRTPYTPLTKDELEYAARDVQVLPKYLNWLLRNNPNIKNEAFANTCLTKTSIVRIDAKTTIGKEYFGKYTLLQKFKYDCKEEAPKDYSIYKLRTSCFRGGLTFTSGNCAHKLYTNVTSLDVTSMHHAFINGSMIGTKYKLITGTNQDVYFESVIHTSLSTVLDNYEQPFKYAFNACIIFENIRLKENSVFERLCIACLAETRFKSRNNIETAKIQDECENPKFAFSKLLSADKIKVCITEYELYNIAMVYQWDDYRVLYMEGTDKFRTPPEYISLQSNKLFEQKNICKKALKGTLQNEDISFMPLTYQEQIRNNCLNKDDFEVYYTNTIKGMFNGIYGTQAMNPIKDTYIVDTDGNILIDETSRPTKDNFADIKQDWSKILYTYGMRIVGRSRTHLLIAIYLLDLYFDKSIQILAGDTDSLKIACETWVADEQIMQALQPLHDAITNALNKVQQHNRECYTQYASNLKNVGCFEIETPQDKRYKYHMEYWNKARISIDYKDKVHLTFAGLPTKCNGTSIIDVLQSVYEKFGVLKCFNILGYNLEISANIAHTLEHKIPHAKDRIRQEITDYNRDTYLIDLPQCIALYPTSRTIGSTCAIVNKENYEYLKLRNVQVNNYLKELEMIDNTIIYREKGNEILRFDME